MHAHDHAPGCSSRTALHGAIQTFGQQLRGVLCSVADNVDRLQRQTEMQPGTSAREFRLVVQDLEEELSELTQEVALLQRFSMDAISFEELLGHCTSLYKSNRDTAIRVHQRLQQAGCSLPDGGLQQPEEPLQHMQQPSRGMSSAAAVTFSANVRGMEGHDDGWLTERDDRGGSAVASSLRNRQQTPGFPRGGQRRQAYDDDEEDEEEQEGDGRAAHAGLGQQQPAAAKPHARAACDENTDPQHGADHQQPAVRPLTSNLLPPTAAKQTSFRPSMDSRASSTPDMFALSPSLLALQHKYGSGGSDMAGAPMPASMPASSAEPSPPSNDDMDADPPSMPTTAPGRPESAAGGSSNGGGTQPWSQQAQANSGASQPSGGQAQQQSSSGRQTDGTAAQQQQQQQQQYMQYSQQQYTPQYQEEDTLNLYQELIRSKGVPAPRNIVRKSATPKKQLQQQQEQQQQQQQQQQRMAAAAEAAGAGFEDTEMSEQAPAAAGTAVQGAEAAAVTQQQQQQQQGGAKGKAQAVALASALEQLEDLWVSSGQAALTPSRARRPEGDLGTPSRSRGATPARSRGATPSRSRPQHNHFTREAARAASEAQAREAAAVSQQQQQQQLQQHAAMRGTLDAGVAMQQQQQQQAGSGSSLSSLSSASAQPQQQQPASGSSNTITPALPPSLVPGFGLALQMQGSSGPRVLSPGTSQLLSAVYGSAAIQQAGLSAIQPERQQSLPQQQPQPPASAAAVGARLYTAPAPTQPQAGSNAGFAGNVGSQVPAPTPVPSNAQHAGAASDPAAVPEAVAAGYAALPAFCRSQLSLEQLGEGLQQLRRLVDSRRYAGGDANAFSLADLEQQGMAPAKSKVFINCLVKLGCAELQKATGGGFGYVLK